MTAILNSARKQVLTPRGNETDIDEFEYRKPAECRVSVVDIMQVVCLSATDETVVVK